MPNIGLISVSTPEQLAQLAELAERIWNEYWPSIIGQAQTSYMVEKFQSEEALKQDIINNGYEYWFISAQGDELDERIIGYTGGHEEVDSKRFFISKIYLLPEERGCGLSSQIIGFYEKLCKERGLTSMYLTVNKHNEIGIRAYKNNGFKVTEAVCTDIGKGFVMDDYIMEKRI